MKPRAGESTLRSQSGHPISSPAVLAYLDIERLVMRLDNKVAAQYVLWMVLQEAMDHIWPLLTEPEQTWLLGRSP